MSTWQPGNALPAMCSRAASGGDNKLGISAQLLEDIAGSHLWVQNFDAAIEDIFDMQVRIIETVIASAKPVFVVHGIDAEGQAVRGV
jgi:hypothetical protein